MSTLTTKDRKERLALAYTNLLEKEGILSLLRLRSSAGLRRFSLGNIISIMFEAEITQRPMPRMLHTYKDWQAEHRQVRQGEKAWHVLAPVKRMVPNDADDESKGKRQIIVNWFWMSQFDVSQTDGPELPELCSHELTSDQHMSTLVALIDWCAQEGMPVCFEITGNYKGWYTPDEHSITISVEPAPDEQLAILIHECIHGYCNVNYKDFARDEAEMITESATAIVCMGLGLEHIEQSIEYVAGWSGSDPERAITIFDKAERAAFKLEEALGMRLARKQENKEAVAA